jgi:CDP-glucose 4,6-dehydratase
MNFNKDFWNRKRVLITGHTGFKGSWLCFLLHRLGSDVYGYALDPPTDPNLYEIAGISDRINSSIGDIRDYDELFRIIQSVKPEIVIHMAAQALVIESYQNPIYTYATNVMGTVNLLEAVRNTKGIKAVVNVSTDKCYENKEWHWGYREDDPLGGYDPYSNSKGCSELVTAAYRNSFFNKNNYNENGVVIASARAGNVIGGGDWAKNRLIPDFIRAVSKGTEVSIRNPFSIRPWQHVLEPLCGYLMLAERLYTEGYKFAQAWNFGPDDADSRDVEWIATRFAELWGKGFDYQIDRNPQPHEASYLKLDCSKAKTELNWYPQWDIDKALGFVVEWYRAWFNKEDIGLVIDRQIQDYFSRN